MNVWSQQVRYAYISDLDGDGDGDVISASWGDDEIAWYENTNGLGSFGPQRIINDNADGALSVYSSDLDGDGDQDVVSGSFLDSKLAWYENTDGIGGFGSEQIIFLATGGLSQVIAGDIDGDGDNDLVSASQSLGRIFWYENSFLSSVTEYEFSNFNVSPIPTENILKIQSESIIIRIEILNVLGQLVLANANQTDIDLSSIKTGYYICRVTNQEGQLGVRKIIKK